ncbi:MAG: COX15/CtaA family protein [Cytophagaceae bacterium]
MQNNTVNTATFRRFGIFTIVAVYLLILAGGIVRSTGSGMGCPDWPRCFGRWIPPTHISELPADYMLKYKVEGHSAEFNATKTWIEYINRLLGAIIGFLIFLVVVYSVPFLKKDKTIFYLSLLTFILVGFEAWLGKVVVATNLSPIMITIHMAGSLVILALLIYIISRSQTQHIRFAVTNRKYMELFLWVLIALTFIQILGGTQVREQIDEISFAMGNQQRETWISKLGGFFVFHRIFSVIVLAANSYFLFIASRRSDNTIFIKSARYSLGLLFFEFFSGVVMAVLDIPAFIQPIHLLCASLIFGLQFFMLVLLYFSEEVKSGISVKMESL